MPSADDPGIASVLGELGLGPDSELGHGGEACVCALDDERIVRIHATGTDRALVTARTELLAELARSADAVPFALPTVFERRTLADHELTIEARLPGESLDRLLAAAAPGPARTDLVHAYLEAAARIGDLRVRRPWFGDLCGAAPIRTGSFREYLAARAAHNLARAGWADGVDPDALAAAWPELQPESTAARAPESAAGSAPASGSLVHLDAFPANMMACGGRVSAVFDFGTISLIGDRRLDPLTAAIYLEPTFTPAARAADREAARAWLDEHGLLALWQPARRWLAAYWAGALDHAGLQAWSKQVLLEGR